MGRRKLKEEKRGRRKIKCIKARKKWENKSRKENVESKEFHYIFSFLLGVYIGSLVKKVDTKGLGMLRCTFDYYDLDS